MTGRLHQGDHLRLDRLAGELGISVTPIREALLALRGEGFVDLEPRRGFTVATLTRKDIEDAYQVQAMLAGELAARAAHAISDEQLAQLEALQEELERAAQRYDADVVEELNHRFHDAINASADSPKLTWFLCVAARYAPQRFMATISGGRDASIDDHRWVLRALRNRDGADARASMHAHIAHSGDLLVRHLERQNFWPAGH